MNVNKPCTATKNCIFKFFLNSLRFFFTNMCFSTQTDEQRSDKFKYYESNFHTTAQSFINSSQTYYVNPLSLGKGNKHFDCWQLCIWDSFRWLRKTIRTIRFMSASQYTQGNEHCFSSSIIRWLWSATNFENTFSSFLFSFWKLCYSREKICVTLKIVYYWIFWYICEICISWYSLWVKILCFVRLICVFMFRVRLWSVQPIVIQMVVLENNYGMLSNTNNDNHYIMPDPVTPTVSFNFSFENTRWKFE